MLVKTLDADISDIEVGGRFAFRITESGDESKPRGWLFELEGMPWQRDVIDSRRIQLGLTTDAGRRGIFEVVERVPGSGRLRIKSETFNLFICNDGDFIYIAPAIDEKCAGTEISMKPATQERRYHIHFASTPDIPMHINSGIECNVNKTGFKAQVAIFSVDSDPGLANLPSNSRAREVYPENWQEGGKYVQFPVGRVRYWLVGPESGKKIVLIHGLTIPAIAFGPLVPILVNAGYRVLLYDLYGRGYSDAPLGVPYDAKLYVTQLALLLQHIKWERVHVVGFSMGGAIAASFVAIFPALVEKKVVLIASAGASEIPAPSLRGKDDYAQDDPLKRITRKSPTTLSESPIQEIVRLQVANLKGYWRAVFSSLHDGPITRMRWAFESNQFSGRRVLLIHGTRDPVVPPVHSPILKSFLESAGPNAEDTSPPRTTLVEIPGAGHDLTWTHADDVGRALLAFLDDGA
ncbi:Alpha/Beta hydrolase protein [Mycena epipterygia]|nr:Alpha/Beta hydrolase protein [Mycena epipterygia]